MPETTVIACPACNRNNGIHRMSCIYCGHSLPVEAGRELEKLPSLRQLEETELGFNLVYFPSDSLSDESALREIEVITRLDSLQIAELIKASVPVPIARAQTQSDAEIFYRRLLAAGVRTTIVSDADLSVNVPPRRIRRIKRMEGGIELWSSEHSLPEDVAWNDVSLFVFGAIRYRQILTQEEMKVRRNGRELKDVSETVSDEFLFDFFDGRTSRHFRIRSDSFDYNCLADQRKLLAQENYRILDDWMTASAPGAIVNRDFRKVTRAIEPIWPLTRTVLRQPLKRIGVGKVSFGSQANLDNENQFTRFSRTLFRLSQKGLFGA